MSTLLTVSGAIPDDLHTQLAAGTRPRPDYLVMSEELAAETFDFVAARRASGRLGRLIERLAGSKALLAWATFRARRTYDVIITDGEQIGLPYALLCRFGGRGGARHLMIVHLLSVKKKTLLWRAFRLGAFIDVLFVYAEAQRRFAIDVLGVPADRVVLTPFMVDAEFFARERSSAAQRRMICSVGLEFRDYATLCDAVEGLDVDVVIAAGSRWSKRPDLITGRPLPANVSICTLDFVDLRDLYAEAQFVVMPLFETNFQAGVTTLLEAMSMGKAVVCSSTTGQTDVVTEGETGLYAPPGDAPALRAAITKLLDNPDLATAMGRRARAEAEDRFAVEHYARGLAETVHA
jgi:glycosyltransferase involved in cell wall biosynthesis